MTREINKLQNLIDWQVEFKNQNGDIRVVWVMAESRRECLGKFKRNYEGCEVLDISAI